MRRLLRRGVVFLLTLALLLPYAPAYGAEQGVYFTAVNDQLLELRQETMPFWKNDTFYVPGTIFEQSDCGITFTCNYILGLAILYSADTDLRYMLDGAGDGVTKTGKIYRGGLIQKGDMYFFPLTSVCRCFGLTWSFIEAEPAPILRIQDGNAVLSDFRFADAAGNQMESRFAAYEKQRADAEKVAQPVTPTIPTVDETAPIQAAAGQKVYLLLRYTDDITLPTLPKGAYLTLLLDTRQMADGALVRSLLVAGHQIALYADGEDIASQLDEARALLWQAACLWPEQVWFNGSDDGYALLAQEGFFGLTADVTDTALHTQLRLDSLLTLVGKYSGDVCVYLENPKKTQLGKLTQILMDGGYSLCTARM